MRSLEVKKGQKKGQNIMYNVTEKKRKFDLRGHLRLLEVIKVTEVIEAKKATRHRGLKTKQKTPSSGLTQKVAQNGENSSSDMKYDDEKFLIRRFVVVVAKLFDLLKKGGLKHTVIILFPSFL